MPFSTTYVIDEARFILPDRQPTLILEENTDAILRTIFRFEIDRGNRVKMAFEEVPFVDMGPFPLGIYVTQAEHMAQGLIYTGEIWMACNDREPHPVWVREQERI